MDILFMLLMFAGVHLAYITHRAGLPRFAIAMTVMTLIGYPLILAGQVIGVPFVLISMVLATWSHSIMKQYHIGPFAHRDGRR